MNTFFSFLGYVCTFRPVRAWQVAFGDPRKLGFQEFLENPPMYIHCRVGLNQSDRQIKKGMRKIYNSWENPDYFTIGTKVFSEHRSRIDNKVTDLFGSAGQLGIIEPVCGDLATQLKEELRVDGHAMLNGLFIEPYNTWGSGGLIGEISSHVDRVYESILHPGQCPNCHSSSWCLEHDYDEDCPRCDECDAPYKPKEDPLEDGDIFGKFMACCAHEDKTGLDVLEQ